MTDRVYEIAECRHGRFLYNRNDEFIGKGLELYGEWSEAEIHLFRQIVRQGDVVLEAGANIGSHTVFLSQAAGASGQVLAFEAGRHNHQLLCANLALNQCTNVHAIHKAIGRAPGTTRFPLLDPFKRANFGEASVRRAASAAATETVEVQSVDALALERLDFIKADIEGSEMELLEGARQTLSRLRPVLYLEIDCEDGRPAGNRDDLVRMVEEYGYEAYYYMTPMFNPDNFRGVKEDIYGAVSLDLVCVPAERGRIEGLSRARLGDSAITILPGAIRYDIVPWNMASFHHSRERG